MTAALPERRRGAVVRWHSLVVLFLGLVLFTANGGLFRIGPATAAAWLLFTALLGIWIAQAPEVFSRIIARHRLLLGFPLLALLSSLWSSVPAVTAIEGTQFLISTILAIYFAHRLDVAAVMSATFWSMAVGLGLSLLNLAAGFLPPVYEVNGAFLGVFTHKTMVARTALWLAIAASYFLLRRNRNLAALLVTLALWPVAFMAQASTLIVSFVFPVLMIVVWQFRRVRTQTIVLCLGLLVFVSVAVMATLVLTGADPVAAGLQALGKSPTLTGRTVLWAIGFEIARESPIAGLGYSAFWNSPDFAEFARFIEAHVDDGLHGFHNGYVEAYVGLGIVGGLWLVGLALFGLGALMRDYLRTRSLDALVMLTSFASIAVMAMIEDTLLKPRSSYIILFMLVLAQRQGLQRRHGGRG